MTESPVSEPVAGTLVSDAVDVATAKSGGLPVRRFASDAAWIITAQILGVICAIGSMRVWAIYLTPAKLGEMALVITFASVLVGVLSGPLMQVLVVCFARHQLRGNEQAFRWETTRIVRTSIGGITIAIVAATGPLWWLFKLDPLFLLSIIPLFAIDTYREYERVLFSCVGRQRMVSLITALDVWARFFFVWGMLAVFGGTARVAILANILGGGIALLSIISLSKRVAYPPRKPAAETVSREMRGEIKAIALPLVPSAVFVNLTEMSSRYIIGATISLSAAGLFVMGYGLVKRPYGMVRDLGALVMMPLLSRQLANGAKGEVRRVRYLWLGGMILVCTSGGVLFYLLRDFIAAVLLTEDYASAVTTLIPILALGIGLFTIASVLDDFLLCNRRSRLVLTNRTIAFIASTILLVLLSKTHGLVGTAWSLVGGGIVHLLVATVNILRQSRTGGAGPRNAGGQEFSQKSTTA